MKSEELRLGNYYNRTDGKDKSVQVNINDMVAWSKGAIYGKPIPLTEEWLVNFGFDLDIGVGVWFGNKFGDYRFTIWDKYEGVEYKFSIENSLYIQLKHVHQLQNLYFALTGEELEIN